MSFIFASSHLPETRVQRPDELEDEEEDVQPMLHSGGVRAFSHLPAKRMAADPAGQGQLSQRGAQALGHQFQRTETQDAATPHEDGIAAAKASGVFDVVRQQLNRDDSPHFMDEDGNLRPRDETRQQDSPSPRDPRSPLGVAGAPPRPARNTGNAAAANSSRSPRTSSSASDDTRPWYMPPITPDDLDSQHFDDDATAGSHSAPKGRPEVQDLVYRTPGASTPKPNHQDLLYRFNGNPEEAGDHRRDYFKNTAAPADGSGHLAQQTNTYGVAPDSRGNGSSHGYADNAGSGSQPDATGTSTRPMSIPEILAQGRIAKEEYTKKWNQLKNPEAAAEPDVQAEPTVEMLEQNEKHLQQQIAGAEMALKKLYEGNERLRNIREAVRMAGLAQGLATELAPLRLSLAVFFGNAAFDWEPKEIMEKIDAELSKRDKQSYQHQENIAIETGKLKDAISKTEVAKHEEKKRELEEKRRQQLEEKKRQQLEDQKSQEEARKVQELKEKEKEKLKWQRLG